jgi:hypothetical protein
VVIEFSYAVCKNILTGRIQEYELVGMHGDSQTVSPYKITKPLKMLPERFHPVDRADRVRGKGDEIRTYPEKQKPFLQIVEKYPFQAAEISTDRLLKPFFRVGSQPEGSIGAASDFCVYARISYFHPFAYLLLFKCGYLQ